MRGEGVDHRRKGRSNGMNERIKTLSDKAIILLAVRAMQNIDNAMTSSGEASHNPYGFGGALSFGWDMPTASMIFPRLTRRYWSLFDEAKRRGIHKAAYTRHRIGKRAKKNAGKIIYTLTEAT